MRRNERELRDYLRELQLAGNVCELGASGKTHYKIRINGQLFTCSYSPRCPHWLDRLKQDIRKFGKVNNAIND